MGTHPHTHTHTQTHTHTPHTPFTTHHTNTHYTNGEAISHQFIMLLDPPKRENGKSWDNFQARGGGFPCPNLKAPQKWYIFMKNKNAQNSLKCKINIEKKI